jgi:hypothetical protein
MAYEPATTCSSRAAPIHRLAPTSPTKLLVVEAASEVGFPDRGMLGQHALFDPAVIEVPTPGEGSSLDARRARRVPRS